MNHPASALGGLCVASIILALSSILLPLQAAPAKTKMRTIHSQPSFVIANDQVEVAVTRLGGHMAPVTFLRDSGRPVQPYHISPWQDEKAEPLPAPVLRALRGDFFCLPFGGNSKSVAGEKHPPHGEIVGLPWTLVQTTARGDVTTMTLGIDTHIRKGRVIKELSLVQGHNVIYTRHLIEGFSGAVPLGHHATLAMPDEEGSVRIATSPIRFGMTNPGLFSDPQHREYQNLLPGARWAHLNAVPAAWKDAPAVDLSRMPSRQGFADLVQLVHQPSPHQPAWVTATFTRSGYVWFALKNPAVLNSTIFWMENRGRHGHPWNGRNNCLGLEDVTAHFADGLDASIHDNALTREGIATTVPLSGTTPTSIHYIQGVVRVPDHFEQVQSIEFQPGQMVLISVTGQHVPAPVRHEFIATGKL